MKKFISCLTLLLLFIWAQPILAEGLIDSASESTQNKVSELSNLDDGAMVILTGNLEKQVSDDNDSLLREDEYVFNDGTGTVVVTIDGDLWMGLTVSPRDIVEIQGEVDKDLSETKVTATRITRR